MQSLFTPNVAQLLLHKIPKNDTPKQTWISWTPFADSMRQIPTERQKAPVRKKLESTVAMLSWGFQAGSFCCLNALLSGHLEGRASPSCGIELVLFFIFFLRRRWEEGIIYLCWRVFKLRYCPYCWETVLFVQSRIIAWNYLLTRCLSSSFSTFVPGSPRSAFTNQTTVYFGQGAQLMPPGKA